MRRRLEYAKGITSFENELTNLPKELVSTSDVIKNFISVIIPTAEPEPWLKKQTLLRDDRPSVAGLLLFADEPQAAIPKRCGIKVYRYKTKEAEGFREALEFDPQTVEGCIYDQIRNAVNLTKQITERIPKMGADSLETIQYPGLTGDFCTR
jgi:ATP-dependent DNA helicase RecG